MDQEHQEHQERRGDVVVDRALRGSGLLYGRIFAAHALGAEAASSRGRGMPYHEERPRFSAGDWSDRSGISAIMPAAAPPLLVSHPLLDSTDLDVVRAVTGRAWGKHASDVIGRDGLSASLPPGVPLAEAALLARIGEHLFGEPPPPGDEPPRERVVVEVLLDWLRAHRAEPVSMGDLAAHAGVFCPRCGAGVCKPCRRSADGLSAGDATRSCPPTAGSRAGRFERDRRCPRGRHQPPRPLRRGVSATLRRAPVGDASPQPGAVFHGRQRGCFAKRIS